MNSHTPHWHGNVLLWAQQRVDIVSGASLDVFALIKLTIKKDFRPASTNEVLYYDYR